MIGRIVSHFRIEERIGAGGMAEVYKALDLDLARPVALKFLTRQSGRDSDHQPSLLEEARAVSKLDHRNICTVHEISETDEGTGFIAMAFYPGETLAQLLKRSQMQVLGAIEIASQVADGLYAAHRREIIHRDVKPSNIMITGEGDVKILDFGIARLIRDEPGHRKAFGTLTYMAPERVKGAEGDERCDIWSLGVIFHMMVAGRVPFRAEGSNKLATAIIHSDPAPITQRTPAEIRAIRGILEQTLAKDPADRYRTAQELRRDLQRARAELAGVEGLVTDRVPTHPLRFAGDDREPRGEESLEVSLAILPLKDLSPEQDQEYFCSGMAEELIFLLTRVPGLRVAVRESALRLIGDQETSCDVGRRLGVANVLEGSIHQSGNRLRVTARLVRVSDDRYLWSGKYDREIEDLFQIQDEIAQEIAAALEVTLIRDPREINPVATGEKLGAHDLYFKGRYYWSKRDAESLKRAIGYFERAIAELPSYARAYAGLANSHAMLGVYGALPPSEVMPVARKAAGQALALDSALAEVYVSRALVRSHYEWDFGRAEKDYRKALELNSHYATAHQQYAMTCLLPLARFEEAFEELRRAADLDPLSVPICVGMGLCYYYSGQYAKAAEEYRKALDIDRTFIRVRIFLAEAYEQQGNLDDALVVVLRAEELSERGPTVLSALGRIYSRSGYRDRAERILTRLLEVSTQRYVAPTLVAQLYAGSDEKQLALDALQRAYDLRSADLIWLGVHPLYQPLREEPVFRRLLEKLGLDHR